VGSYLDGLPDLYLSPVNGQVAGVVAHAAALDNLLNLDDRYIKDMPSLRSLVLELVVLLLAVIALWRLPLGDRLKSLNTGIASLVIWGFLAAVALSVGERSAALQLVVVGLVMDWFKPKAAVQVAVLGLVGAILGLILFQFGFVAFNWINIVLSAWGTAELVKSLQSDAKKREEVEKISLLRSLCRRVLPGAG
jgi:MFS family permease